MIVDEREADYRYLFYQFLNAKAQLKQLATGAAQQNLSGLLIKSLRFPFPLMEEQRAIARVLGSLDDKIELNRRMNETLESLAQTLFQEWFVAPTQAGLPKGWHKSPILHLAKLLSGGTPKTERKDYWNGDILWASAKDVSQCRQTFLLTTERTITQEGLEESATQMIPAFCTVVVARGATTGRMVLFGHEMAMNQTCYALASATGTPFALYCLLRHEMDKLVHSAHGSVFDTITTSTFDSSEVVLPPKEAVEGFEATVSPLFRRILANTEESRTLAGLRDTLLPRLLSGEIRVPEAARVVAGGGELGRARTGRDKQGRSRTKRDSDRGGG
jgi:type I restriction enzyme S subunit